MMWGFVSKLSRLHSCLGPSEGQVRSGRSTTKVIAGTRWPFVFSCPSRGSPLGASTPSLLWSGVGQHPEGWESRYVGFHKIPLRHRSLDAHPSDHAATIASTLNGTPGEWYSAIWSPVARLVV